MTQDEQHWQFLFTWLRTTGLNPEDIMDAVRDFQAKTAKSEDPDAERVDYETQCELFGGMSVVAN